MHDHASWSLNLGRWGGVRVRLHMFFLLFAAFTFYLSWRSNYYGQSNSVDWLAVHILCVLLVSVAIHEVGHLIAAWRFGGRLESVVLGPLGGLTSVRDIRQPRSELVAHLAGPAANLTICLLCIPILMATSTGFVGLLHPLAPQGLAIGEHSMLLRSLQLLFWVNWSLALINLLPVFPFDGGRALRAIVLIKWPEAGRPAASHLVVTVAKFIAVGVFITAFLLKFGDAENVLPMRFALVLLAIFMFFSAQHEERRCAEEVDSDDLLMCGEFSSDLSELEQALSQSSVRPTGPVKRWMERRRELRIERQLEVEAAEEQSVDEILDRLHKRGMDALSSADKALLERVSARLRSRHGS
jgi:Zn-dependent protease